MVFQPLKYLIEYPFSPLSIAKIMNLFLYVSSLLVWQLSPLHTETHFFSFLTPFFDLVSLAILLISLWFTVQKFYWRNVEITFNICGFALSIETFLVLFFHKSSVSDMSTNIMYNHCLTSISWFFCILWSRYCTQNTVSNLFIAEWGDGVDDVEIEALQDHF